MARGKSGEIKDPKLQKSVITAIALAGEFNLFDTNSTKRAKRIFVSHRSKFHYGVDEIIDYAIIKIYKVWRCLCFFRHLVGTVLSGRPVLQKMKKFKYLALSIILFAFVFAPAMMSASTKGQGESFNGSVTINGSPAPDGTSIGIKVGDILVALTTTKDGKYGYGPSPLVVYDPDGTRAGKLIKILVNDQVAADEFVYTEGISVSKDLKVSASPGGQVLGVSTFKFNRSLAIGSSGQDVLELQKRLTAEDLYSGPITGYFGPLTLKAVKAYQLKNNISTVGAVGPITRNKLNNG